MHCNPKLDPIRRYALALPFKSYHPAKGSETLTISTSKKKKDSSTKVVIASELEFPREKF